MLCLSFFLPPRQFILQLPDSGLGRQPAFPFGQPAFLFGQPGFLFGQLAFPLLLEGGYLLPRLRVVPAELPAFPSDEKVQHGAVALQDSFLALLYGDRIIPALRKLVPGQLGPVELVVRNL